jgi:type VI secretion system ImpM family protein
MMHSAQALTGYFGKLRSVAGFVGASLPPEFIDRWDAWYNLASGTTPPGPIAYDEPAWRFSAAEGLFGPAPAAGVWRHSQDSNRQRYPFVIATLGHNLAVDDPWFDAAEPLLTQVVEEVLPLPDLARQLAKLPPTVSVGPVTAAILMWRDDWEVHELSFATGRDFAAFGLPGDV